MREMKIYEHSATISYILVHACISLFGNAIPQIKRKAEGKVWPLSSILFCYLIFSMSLYFISAYSIGCYKDTGRRAIRTLEGRSPFLKGQYRRRRDAIRKCFQAAYRRGYKMFALQHGGWCASSRMAHVTYRRYGKSNRCRNGKGGPWANDVYVLRG